MSEAPDLETLLLAAYPARHRLNGEGAEAWESAVAAGCVVKLAASRARQREQVSN